MTYSDTISQDFNVQFLGTWVQRPSKDEPSRYAQGHQLLSEFQREKFSYYFCVVLDHNKDGVVQRRDLDVLNEVMY